LLIGARTPSGQRARRRGRAWASGILLTLLPRNLGRGMICANCRAAVPDGAKFCIQCGAALMRGCRACGHPVPAGAKFCPECGTECAEAVTGGPRQTTHVLHATPPAFSVERRQLTVMFCDLVGSTSLASGLDPEDLRVVIGAYHRCVAETVAHFSGYVAKYMGDGVLAYFGYPRANENDAERAVRTGLALVELVSRVPAPNPLQARVGIETGLVVVGDLIGSGEAHERGVVGQTPNLAARLQELAEPNTVLIGGQTRRLLGELFEYHDRGAVTLKGVSEPVHAYQVLGLSAVESRFQALHGSALVPMIGREEELELLLRRWERAKRGDGQVVLMSGEPGIGKSRLTADFEERIANEPHEFVRHFCSPHHQDSALHPITAELERSAGFGRNDTLKTKLEKLKALLGRAAVSNADAGLLAELLSLPTSGGSPPSDLTPQRKREHTFQALLRRLESLSHRHPVLVLFEDVHWSDPTTRELLDRIIEQVRKLRILVVLTLRPEFRPPWIGQAHVTMLTLNRLDQRDGTALVRRIAGGTDLPHDIVSELVDRSDGVPFVH
jgi:class 3 adenylate cyclase/RNA polymerase subunit RPABC4/transcription elongation factor Spt4